MYTLLLLLGTAPSISRPSLSRPSVFRLFMPSGTTILIYSFLLFFLSDTLPPLRINFRVGESAGKLRPASFCALFMPSFRPFIHKTKKMQIRAGTGISRGKTIFQKSFDLSLVHISASRPFRFSFFFPRGESCQVPSHRRREGSS